MTTGLTTAECTVLHEKFGFNETRQHKTNWFLEVVKKFTGLTAYMLEMAAVVCLLEAFVTGPIRIHSLVEGVIILALLLLNALLGLVQQVRSVRAVEALKQRLQIQARVLRDAQWSILPSRELVPGDVVRIRNGDIVPADMVVHEGRIAVDQSALTGESDVLEKEPGSGVYSGSVVRRGEGTGVVTAIGLDTEFGKTAELMSTSSPKMHVEAVTNKVALATLLLVAFFVAVTVVIKLVMLAVKRSTGQEWEDAILQLIPLALTLLVSGVPVALPAMFSITMALGSRRLVRKNVLVTRLNAAEDAANMTILCSDKTGTLTKNELAIVDTVPEEPFTTDDIIFYGSLASNAANNDPIDLAFLKSASENSAILSKSRQYRQIGFHPFDPLTRRTEAVVQNEQNLRDLIHVVKGSQHAITDMCGLGQDKQFIKKLDTVSDSLAQKGYRAIAVAYRQGQTENDESPSFRFVGMVAMSDTPREESRTVVEMLQKLGVRIIMLTGDAQQIAKQIALQVSLGAEIISMRALQSKFDNERMEDDVMEDLEMIETTGSSLSRIQEQEPNVPGHTSHVSVIERNQLKREKKKMEEAEKRPSLLASIDLNNIDGIAEIFPEDKHAIVKMLQDKGHVVGMTGDGVNDAPALKQAEVGVAMCNATDIAKGSASVVLTTEGLGSVPELIRTGRMIHQRIRTWLMNKIVKTFQNVLLVVIAFFVLQVFVLSSMHILILLFLVDFVTVALATDNARPSKKPQQWRVLRLSIVSCGIGIATVIEMFGLILLAMYEMGYDRTIHLPALQTLVFEAQFFFGLCTIFSVRERMPFFYSRPSTMLAFISAMDSILVLAMCIFGIPTVIEPLRAWWHAFVVLGVSCMCIVVNDGIKLILLKAFVVTKKKKKQKQTVDDRSSKQDNTSLDEVVIDGISKTQEVQHDSMVSIA